MATNKTSYQYFEDNGGGLHLFVLSRNGKVRDGITNLEYASEGEFEKVKESLSQHPVIEVKGWDGHMTDEGIAPQEFYDELSSNDIVCDNGILYPERMGAAAQVYFGATVESEARNRIGKMNFYKSQLDFIFTDWADWFDHLTWLLTATKDEIMSWIES